VRRGVAPHLLLCLLAIGCGRKGPVRPPEFAQPAPIEKLEATNEAEDVLLTWPRPDRYADNSRMTDLGEFRVERAGGGEPEFVTIALLPVTDRERFRQIKRFRFVDRGAVLGESYRYRVVSATVDGYASAPSNVVEIVRAVPTPAPTATPTASAKGKENR